MSALLIIVLILLLVVIFSQFGGSLSATSAWQWWLVGIFLVIGALEPEIYRPIANVLQIRFISNFIFACLVMFLFMQGLSAQVTILNSSRKLRQFICSEAVRTFRQANPTLVTPKALVILPTYNEQDSIEVVIAELKALKAADPSIHFCFVNDGSTDRTKSILADLGPSFYLDHLTNIKVSGALKSGFDLANEINAKYVVQCDSDGQHPVEEIPRMIKDAEANGVDCLIGSRFVGANIGTRLLDGSTTTLRGVGSHCLSFALRMLFGARISDPTSGFRVYSHRAIEILRHNIPDEYPEPESIAIMAAGGLKITETRVAMKARYAGVSSLSGWKGISYMLKVISALVGLRIRTFFN